MSKTSGPCDGERVSSALLSWPIADCLSYRPNREKHGRWGGACIRPALDRLNRDKPILCIEGLGGRLGIHDDSHASVVVRHLQSKPEHEPEKMKADFLSLGRLVDGEPSEPEHWQWVARELAAHDDRQLVDLDLGRRRSGKSEDVAAVDRDIRDAKMVPKLILPGKLLKEAIEIDITRAKRSAVVVLAKRLFDEVAFFTPVARTCRSSSSLGRAGDDSWRRCGHCGPPRARCLSARTS